MPDLSAQIAADARDAERRDAYRPEPIRWVLDHTDTDPASLVWDRGGPYAPGDPRLAHEWDGDVNPLVRAAFDLATGHRPVHLVGDPGVGKTRLAAGLALWFLDTFVPSRVLAVGPTQRALVAGVGHQVRRLIDSRGPEGSFVDLHPGAQWQGRSMVVSTNRYGDGTLSLCAARCGRGAALALKGVYTENLLVIVDDAQEMPRAALRALRAALTGPNHKMLLLDTRDDPFPMTRITASSHDHPNVVTGQLVVPGATQGQRRDD